MRCEIMRKFSILLMIVGISIIGYAVYQIFLTNNLQKESLAEAKEILVSDEPASDTSDNFDFTPEIGETVGILHIPKLDAELPIVEGTDEIGRASCRERV